MRESTRQKFANVDWNQTLEEAGKCVGVTKQRAHQVKEELSGNPAYSKRPSDSWWFNQGVEWASSSQELADKFNVSLSAVYAQRRLKGKSRDDAVNALLSDRKSLLETISTIESQLNSMKLMLGNSRLLP